MCIEPYWYDQDINWIPNEIFSEYTEPYFTAGISDMFKNDKGIISCQISDSERIRSADSINDFFLMHDRFFLCRKTYYFGNLDADWAVSMMPGYPDCVDEGVDRNDYGDYFFNPTSLCLKPFLDGDFLVDNSWCFVERLMWWIKFSHTFDLELFIFQHLFYAHKQWPTADLWNIVSEKSKYGLEVDQYCSEFGAES